MKTLAIRGMAETSHAHYAIYESYMASRAQYVRLPGSLSVSSGSRGSGDPVSSLFSTTSSGSNPTLSANLSLFVFNDLAGDVGSMRAMQLLSSPNQPLRH